MLAGKLAMAFITCTQ